MHPAHGKLMGTNQSPGCLQCVFDWLVSDRIPITHCHHTKAPGRSANRVKPQSETAQPPSQYKQKLLRTPGLGAKRAQARDEAFKRSRTAQDRLPEHGNRATDGPSIRLLWGHCSKRFPTTAPPQNGTLKSTRLGRKLCTTRNEAP